MKRREKSGKSGKSEKSEKKEKERSEREDAGTGIWNGFSFMFADRARRRMVAAVQFDRLGFV